VGPRPSVTYELGDYDTLNARYKKRFTVLPGITGYAQVMGRNEIPWDIKVNYDNEYIDLFAKQGFWLDIKIIFKTAVNIFKKEDIYEEKTDESMGDIEAAQAAEREIITKAHEIEEN
jgi:lipopolysaccharide/colanic/teichoic acid biosynthesis glycosyltransferase